MNSEKRKSNKKSFQLIRSKLVNGTAYKTKLAQICLVCKIHAHARHMRFVTAENVLLIQKIPRALRYNFENSGIFSINS